MTRISDSGLSVAVVGATGQVGTVMREILAERSFPIRELRLFATARSAGTPSSSADTTVIIEDVATADPAGIDIALFSAGATGSRAHAPAVRRGRRRRHRQLQRLAHGPRGSARRQRGQPHAIAEARKGIIANPNCTTMAAMPVLKVLRRRSRPRAPHRQHLPGRQRLGSRRVPRSSSARSRASSRRGTRDAAGCRPASAS